MINQMIIYNNNINQMIDEFCHIVLTFKKIHNYRKIVIILQYICIVSIPFPDDNKYYY